jgi:hypothetical protein
LRVGELALAGAQGGQRPQHPGQGGAQLVGDGGQQVVLEPVALPQPLDQVMLGLGEPGLLGRHRPRLLGRPLRLQAVLLGLLGLAEGVADGEHRQQDEREQDNALLGHRQQDRRHGEDHRVRPGLGPEALLEVGGEVPPVGQRGDHADQDQVADEEDERGDGERRQVLGAERPVATQQLVDSSGHGHQ